MSSESTDGESRTLSPDDAFQVLGNETRMEILQTLGEAAGPLSFSEVRDRVGMRDSGQFNYHLDKVEGHFVEQRNGGYALRQAGRRVIQTVLSGAITEDPVVQPEMVDEPCPICGAPTVVAFHRERLNHYCSECSGYYGMTTPLIASGTSGTGADETTEYGYLGSVIFPPAGLQGRSSREMFQAGTAWFMLAVVAMANQVCPRCSARLSTSVSVCEEHDATDGPCNECKNRHAILAEYACTNCLFERDGPIGLTLMTNGELLAFFLSHGLNPIDPSNQAVDFEALMDYEEEVLSMDPFEARFIFTLDTDSLSLTVNEDLDVIEVRGE